MEKDHIRYLLHVTLTSLREQKVAAGEMEKHETLRIACQGWDDAETQYTMTATLSGNGSGTLSCNRRTWVGDGGAYQLKDKGESRWTEKGEEVKS